MTCRPVALCLLVLLAPAATSAPAAEPAVESLTLTDTTYGLQRPVWIYTSPGVTDAATPPCNLFVFLQKEYIEDLAIPARLQQLVAAGEIPPTIAVIVDTSTERPDQIANSSKFDRFVTGDLLPWLRARLGELPPPSQVVIAGISVQGLAATYTAFRHPDVFGNVLAHSAALWRGNEGATEPGEWLTGQLRTSPRLPLRFYVEVGSEETRLTPSGVAFVDAARHLRDVLAAKGYEFRYSEVPRAIHDPEHLQPTVTAGIGYLSRHEP